MELHHQYEGPDHIVTHPDGVVLRFKRVTEHHDEVTALCTIAVDGMIGAPPGKLFSGKLILTGPRSKGDAAAACDRRAKGILDWGDLVDAACDLVRDKLEEGEPIYDLAEVHEGDDEDARYLVAPFLREEQHTVLFGKGGCGKSTIALLLALTYTEGKRCFTLEAGGKGKVLYLDYEDTRKDTSRRLRTITAGMGGETPSIYYKRGTASLANMADELARQIDRADIDGLIVDSAALACGADPEKAEVAIAYFNALRSMRLKWSLTIAHQSKTMDEKEPMPFGSVFWWNSPRIIWQARAAKIDGSPSLHIGLWNHKNQHDEKAAPLGFQLDFSPGCAALLPEPPRRVEDFVGYLNHREKIIGALERADQPVTYEQLAKATGINDNSLRTTMRRLGDHVEKVGNGFRLVDQGASVS